ncbi:hypothetical protein [Kushneria aurantia]|uniref:Secreted protein n=1 Tax=Kushneria aurantia TaxID=504092 RepID=A0ABV6G824_9GAMM|nr:hypothetical protein [Kushneria aurantia]
MKTEWISFSGAVMLSALLAAPALADQSSEQHSPDQQTSADSGQMQGERLSGSQIQERVLGHRVTGAMAGGSQYNEVYRVDGTIEGEGYTGEASIEGNQMCFDYGDGNTCYQVRMVGDNQIEWLSDGEVVGHGTISAIE